MKIKHIPLFIIFSAFFSSVFGTASSISVYPTGADSQYLEAASYDNPVLHFRVNDDGSGDTLKGLSIKNTIDSMSYGFLAGEPASIASSGVKVWRVTPDSGVFNPSGASTFLIGTMTVSGATQWSGTFNENVSNGDGIWVTVDVQGFPAFGVMQMQTSSVTFNGNPGVASSDEPALPPALLVTSSTAANNLGIYHSNGNMQSFVSTGQDNIIAYKLSFINNSGSNSAPVQINAVTITADVGVKPSDIISSIKIQDADQGILYGELPLSEIPVQAVPMRIPVNINIPNNTTVTANVIITISSDPLSANKNFALDLAANTNVEAVDAYTGIQCGVNPMPYDSFPMQSTFATIQKNAARLDMSFDGTAIPANISKGQTNIPLSVLTLTNTGDTSSAFIEIYSIKVHLKDNAGFTVIPSELFSKISVTNQTGDTTYGFKTASTLETSGGIITIPLANPIAVPPASNVKVTIKADISSATTLNNFMIGIESASDLLARDKNSFLSVPVADSAQGPYYSNLALLTSSFNVSHIPSMPANIYKGQDPVKPLTLTFSNPLIYGSGNLVVRGLTLTVKDAAGGLINADTMMSGITAVSPHFTYSIPSVPASGQVYILFPTSLMLSSVNASESVSITVSVKQDASNMSMQISLDSPSMVDAYQDSDPNRKIYISAALGDQFGMSSGTGYITGDSSNSSFTSYPNPFKPGKPARFAYFLDQPSKVTIRIYDMSGSLVAKIIDNADRPAGSHNEDTWDAGGLSGRSVLAGTYIVELVIKPASGSEKKTTKKITYLK
jgi:hypothetical protein